MPPPDFEFNESHIPLAYFITFRTYGTWLHGDERGSVDKAHNVYGTPFAQPNSHRQQYRQQQLRQAPVILNEQQRAAVEEAIRSVCDYRQWSLRAINVRTNHVHLVLTAGSAPEAVMQDFKAYATRRLRSVGLMSSSLRVWSRHGSTRYLWTLPQIDRACDYVINGQDSIPFER